MAEEKTEVSKEEVKKESKERYEVAQVVTETGLAIKDNNTEKVFTQEDLFAEVLNKLDKIERAIA